MSGFLAFLDRRRFLGYNIWEFSFHSLLKSYGQVFLWRMALPHPRQLIRALRRFPKLSGELSQAGFVVTSGQRGSDYDLVAGSFCQKPFGCPVGRFNHRCLKAERLPEQAPRICTTCPLGRVVDLAVEKRADFYVMTSALDIAYDLFLPNLRVRRWTRALFVLCPYSAQPFLLASLLARFESILVTFCCGDCRNYRDFALADRGIKAERTRVAPALWQRFFPKRNFLPRGRFSQRGNVYRFQV